MLICIRRYFYEFELLPTGTDTNTYRWVYLADKMRFYLQIFQYAWTSTRYVHDGKSQDIAQVTTPQRN